MATRIGPELLVLAQLGARRAQLARAFHQAMESLLGSAVCVAGTIGSLAAPGIFEAAVDLESGEILTGHARRRAVTTDVALPITEAELGALRAAQKGLEVCRLRMRAPGPRVQHHEEIATGLRNILAAPDPQPADYAARSGAWIRDVPLTDARALAKYAEGYGWKAEIEEIRTLEGDADTPVPTPPPPPRSTWSANVSKAADPLHAVSVLRSLRPGRATLSAGMPAVMRHVFGRITGDESAGFKLRIPEAFSGPYIGEPHGPGPREIAVRELRVLECSEADALVSVVPVVFEAARAKLAEARALLALGGQLGLGPSLDPRSQRLRGDAARFLHTRISSSATGLDPEPDEEEDEEDDDSEEAVAGAALEEMEF